MKSQSGVDGENNDVSSEFSALSHQYAELFNKQLDERWVAFITKNLELVAALLSQFERFARFKFDEAAILARIDQDSNAKMSESEVEKSKDVILELSQDYQCSHADVVTHLKETIDDLLEQGAKRVGNDLDPIFGIHKAFRLIGSLYDACMSPGDVSKQQLVKSQLSSYHLEAKLPPQKIAYNQTLFSTPNRRENKVSELTETRTHSEKPMKGKSIGEAILSLLGLGSIIAGIVLCCTGLGAAIGAPLIGFGVACLFSSRAVGKSEQVQVSVGYEKSERDMSASEHREDALHIASQDLLEEPGARVAKLLPELPPQISAAPLVVDALQQLVKEVERPDVRSGPPFVL